MKTEIQKAFQVPLSLKVERLEEEEGKTVIYCTVKQKAVRCKHCGGKTRWYDWRTQRKRHTVVGGKEVWLCVKKRRLLCKECKKVFMETPEGLGKRSQMTDHCIQQIQEKSRGQDYSSVSREMGVSCATVSRRVWELPVQESQVPKKKNSA